MTLFKWIVKITVKLKIEVRRRRKYIYSYGATVGMQSPWPHT